MSHRLAKSAFALAGALAVGTPAVAAPWDFFSQEQVVAVVKVDDPDLRTVEGAKQLAHRIRLAAAHVCGVDGPVFRDSDPQIACRHHAIARAVRGLNAPLLNEALGLTPPTTALTSANLR
jgi:UrcA family protein